MNQTSGGNEPAAQERRELIRRIEVKRESRVLTYFLRDQQGALAQISEDAVRPMYDHLRAMGKVPRIDLYLYSVGGQIEVPWRIVSMIREFTDHFAVLVPYKAMSAATMISLGADEIVMGPKGELGPIDPQVTINRPGEGGPLQENFAIEDIMSYLRFIQERVGITDQNALAGPVTALAGTLGPPLLGQINRIHSHIRSVAQKLLTSRTAGKAADEQHVKLIIEMLAEKTYQHGHAIGRKEAGDIGLDVAIPDQELEELIWDLYLAYEAASDLPEPFDARTFVPPGMEQRAIPLRMGFIESLAVAHWFEGELSAKVKRQMPNQIQMNANLNLQLPAGIDYNQLPQEAQQVYQQLQQQLLQQLQQLMPVLVQQQLTAQAPTIGFDAWLQSSAWRRVSEWVPATD